MQAEFYDRVACISCESKKLRTIDSGRFGDEPHRTMLLNSPWGESPFPFLEHCEWRLVQCSDCTQIFHQRVLTPEWAERRFSKWMTEDAIQEFLDLHGSRTPKALFHRACRDVDHVLCIEKMTRSLRGNDAPRILDFGCGWGRFISLATLFGFEAHGIDRSTARIENALSRAPIHPSLEAFRESSPQPMHAATLFEVLEHLEEPRAILHAIHGQLAPSGILVVEVPNCEGVTGIRTAADLIIGGLDHLNAFSPQTLRGIVERAGFVRVRRATAQVTADFPDVLKREVRRVVERFRRPSTQQYFRRV